MLMAQTEDVAAAQDMIATVAELRLADLVMFHLSLLHKDMTALFLLGLKQAAAAVQEHLRLLITGLLALHQLFLALALLILAVAVALKEEAAALAVAAQHQMLEPL